MFCIVELRMFEFRLYPSRVQRGRLFSQFDSCKELYNELLELNNKTYAESGKGLRKFDFNNALKGKYPELFSQVKQNVSDRVGKAYQNFFRRVKDPSCKKKGFPRFKSRVHSITYPQKGFKLLSDKRLYCARVGNVPIVLHRAPKGKIKTLTIKRNRAGQWFAVFACEVESKKVKHRGKKVGVDVGIESFATLSDGVVIENPRLLLKSEKRLRRLQRRMSKTVKGSNNRRKARYLVARQHLGIENQRKDFLHKTTHALAVKYSEISVEDLTIKNMVRNHCLAKHIHDASWSTFFNMLSYKAVTCGGAVIRKNPRNTSKTCSQCGAIIDMPLRKRVFNCPHCGFVCHRDLNAAINIEGRAGLARTKTPVDIRPPRRVSEPGASPVNETGTTRDPRTPQSHAVAGSPPTLEVGGSHAAYLTLESFVRFYLSGQSSPIFLYLSKMFEEVFVEYVPEVGA
jgi:putative transposase